MSLEKEFSAFEQALTRVGREYDVFLYGSQGRLPVDSRKRLQEMARSLSAQRIESAADRYRMNTMLGRYNTQVELWERAVRDKEEGRGRFSRVSSSSSSVPLNAPPAVSVNVVAGPSPDEMLFARFRDARHARGEDVSRLSLDRFREQLAREREKLTARTGHAQWDFDLADEGEKVRLVARQSKGNAP
jgi:hypothetical protein